MSNDNIPGAGRNRPVQADTASLEHHYRSGHEKVYRKMESIKGTTRKALEAAYQKSLVEARLLYEAGHLLGSTLDPDRIFETMRQLVSEIMRVDSLLVSAFDAQTNLITCSYAWVEGSRVDVRDFPAVPLSPDGRGMQSGVIRSGEPLLITDAFERAMTSRSHYHVDPDGTVHDRPTEQKPQSRSILMVPIKLEGQVLGVVQLQSLVKGAYSDEDLRILEAIVLQMAAATRNAFLYQQVKEELAERERTAHALRESEAKYRNLVETSNDLIWSLAPDGRLLFVNQAVQPILGFLPSEMIGCLITDFLAEEQAQKTPGTFQEFLRSTTPLQFETFFRSKAGDPVLMAIHGVVLRDEQGAVCGATGTATDITERRRLQEQLLQAQKMEMVGRLAGGIAHDFNNLMTVIQGHASFALMSLQQGSEAVADLQRIQQAAHRASELTQQLLAFARKQVIETTVVDLNDLISDMDKMLRPLFGANVALSLRPQAQNASVRIDPGLFNQVLINLAVNARDAMPQGGELIIATANVPRDAASRPPQMTDKDADFVMLSMTDTGSGMLPEVQAHLFEPFFTTKEVGKGTGLGLATCYGIVQQSGGHIEVQSELGHGTTFRIYLPRVQESAKTAPLSQAADALPRGTETLLLVEDDPMVRKSVMRALHSLGYTVLEASDGHDALRLVATLEGDIHLLITDVIMPQMGGVELAERFREMLPDIPVLFTSGYKEASQASGSPGAALNGTFLQKPFTPALLAQKVRQILENAD